MFLKEKKMGGFPRKIDFLQKQKTHMSTAMFKQKAEYRIFKKWLQIYLLASYTKKRKLKEYRMQFIKAEERTICLVFHNI